MSARLREIPYLREIHLLGKDWLVDYVRHANSGGIERVLL